MQFWRFLWIFIHRDRQNWSIKIDLQPHNFIKIDEYQIAIHHQLFIEMINNYSTTDYLSFRELN